MRVGTARARSPACTSRTRCRTSRARADTLLDLAGIDPEEIRPIAEAMERGGRLAAKEQVTDAILDRCKPIAGTPVRLHRGDRGVSRRRLHPRDARAVGRRAARADPPVRRAGAPAFPGRMRSGPYTRRHSGRCMPRLWIVGPHLMRPEQAGGEGDRARRAHRGRGRRDEARRLGLAGDRGAELHRRRKRRWRDLMADTFRDLGLAVQWQQVEDGPPERARYPRGRRRRARA